MFYFTSRRRSGILKFVNISGGGAAFWDLFDTDDLDTLKFCDWKVTVLCLFYNASEAID
jgi:hypothetical protein